MMDLCEKKGIYFIAFGSLACTVCGVWCVCVCVYVSVCVYVGVHCVPTVFITVNCK
jgi:hypothetical protein